MLVVGAGLAGAEAAYYLARRGIPVLLAEMKPNKKTPAHTSDNFAELVCSNSLKSDDVTGNACGLLKEEMRRLGSITMAAAEMSRVPAGGALAVDREKFSAYITEKLKEEKNITVLSREQTELPEEGIIATGPLTSDALYRAISQKFGQALHFFDASAPIVSKESIDFSRVFTGDRYGKGTGDYLNCPLDKEEYEAFVCALLGAERATLHEFEKGEIFEGCMPVEVMASRGRDTLRFGTLKPVGLYGADGKRPYAVLQLRKENAEGSAYGLVGCQTNLKFGEQKRVFSLIPALANAEFLRYGVMHRNTYLQSPEVLEADYSVKGQPLLFFAGQMTGVEGYVESAASGLYAAIMAERKLKGKLPVSLSARTVMGALANYVSAPNRHFEPMNANYALLEGGFQEIRDKKERRKMLAMRSLNEVERFGALL